MVQGVVECDARLDYHEKKRAHELRDDHQAGDERNLLSREGSGTGKSLSVEWGEVVVKWVESDGGVIELRLRPEDDG